jgi:DNA-binding GntR family transcriptional regulator
VTIIVSELRTAIMEGRLVPGELIRQEALAEQFGVSRIPVREALKSLATSGLLEHTVNSGFTVSQLDESCA